MIKNLLKSLLYFFGFILLSNVLITLLNYFNILQNSVIDILKFIIPILGLFVISYLLGQKSIKKGYLEGLKLGGIIIFTFLIITLILKSFNFKVIIYYLILLLSSVLGSMIGINRKKVAD